MLVPSLVVAGSGAAREEWRTRGLRQLGLSVLTAAARLGLHKVSAVAELARAPRGCHGNQEQAPAPVAERSCGEKVKEKR